MTAQEQHMLHKDANNFSSWITQLPDNVTKLQETGCVILIKITTLEQYPTGKSAMVWYGYGDDPYSVLAKVWKKLCATYPEAELRWRYKNSAEPLKDWKKTIDRFAYRFGSKPKLNESGFPPV